MTTIGPELAPPPWESLRERLVALADDLEGHAPREAAALRATVESWWSDQQGWTDEAARRLASHHEINNALVGVRGNAQLVLLGPFGREPAIRDRLEVVIREADRIQQAAARLRQVRAALGYGGGAARAA
jgi:nitrogen-specific signal transduction histidine kinase